MPSFELSPSGHWTTHSPLFNEYPSIHEEHISAGNFMWILLNDLVQEYWKNKRKEK